MPAFLRYFSKEGNEKEKEALQYIARYQNGSVSISRQHTNCILNWTVWEEALNGEEHDTVLCENKPMPEGAQIIIRLGPTFTKIVDVTKPYRLYPLGTALAVATDNTTTRFL